MQSLAAKAEIDGPVHVRHWHALYTRHQHEKSVAEMLSNKGHEMFLPLVCSVRRWKDRTKQLWLPLFPGYVFMCGGLDRPVQVLSTPGIIHVVGCAGHPAIIPQGQIDTVRQLIESPLRVEPHPFLRCGDRVTVVAGPLIGIEGVLARKKDQIRLVVSFEILGRSAAVEIDSSCVRRIGFFPVALHCDSLSVPA